MLLTIPTAAVPVERFSLSLSANSQPTVSIEGNASQSFWLLEFPILPHREKEKAERKRCHG
jgi:hypothetical protein